MNLVKSTIVAITLLFFSTLLITGCDKNNKVGTTNTPNTKETKTVGATNTPNIKDEDFGDTIDRLLNMSSVTSFSTNSVNTVKKRAKTNYGKPVKDYIIDIYNKLDDNMKPLGQS